ncbi:hypothetical protein JL720_16471 [Aureococcus anophagefferens]|nr:hypothetical protein JL720_16471 [Aureococcus anophagefferens]
MSTARGLRNASECLPCEPGFVCDTAAIVYPTVPCDPGFYCPGGDATATLVCLAGHSCPGGNAVPTDCVAGTYGPTENLAECPRARWLLVPRGSITPDPCVEGYYCPEGTRFAQQYPCPPGSFSTGTMLEAASECTSSPPDAYSQASGLTAPEGLCGRATTAPWGDEPQPDGSDATGGLCAAGSVCVGAAQVPNPDGVDSSGYPCPPGHYCQGSEHEVGCAPGTYQPSSGQGSCLVCPAGKVCRGNTTVPEDCPLQRYCEAARAPACSAGSRRRYDVAVEDKMIYDASVCDLAQYAEEHCKPCPGAFCEYPGTAYHQQYPCPEGHYCLEKSDGPIECPGGYYQPELRATNQTACLGCPADSFCGPGSGIPVHCADRVPLVPLGYKNKVDANNSRTSVADSCESARRARTARTEAPRVRRVPPGYACLGRRSATPSDRWLDRGYECPAGLLPSGSTIETQCAPGSSNPLTGSSNASACVLCNVDAYQDMAGQAYCKECSSTSKAVGLGNARCACVGLNRAFQSSGLCPCDPGYVWFDPVTFKSATTNDASDCQPEVYERCSDENMRDHLGQCTEEDDCSGQCGASGGERDTQSGLCVCYGMQQLDECDQACRDSSDTVSYDASLGSFVTTDANGTSVAVPTSDLDGYYGDVVCNTDDCEVQSMSVSSTSFAGNYGSGAALREARRRRRRLEALGVDPDSEDAEDDASISNPCNADFDYSAFTSLAETASSSATVSSFAFTFTESGLYVFSMSAASDVLTLIKVMDEGTECSTEAAFTPMTSANLNAVGGKLSDDVLDPDWEVLGGLLGGLSLMIFGVIGAIYYFRKQAWSIKTKKGARYRDRAKHADLDKHAKKGAVFRKGGEASDGPPLRPGAGGARDLDEDDEDPRIWTRRAQLQRHHDLVEQEFFASASSCASSTRP